MRTQGYLGIGIPKVADEGFHLLLHIEAACTKRRTHAWSPEEGHHLLVGIHPVERVEHWGVEFTQRPRTPRTLLIALFSLWRLISIGPKSMAPRDSFAAAVAFFL